MNLPEPVDQYVQDHFSRWHEPFCIELDQQGRITQSSGVPIPGFPAVSVGYDAGDVFPGLVGSLDGEDVLIPMMNFGGSSAADIHVIHRESKLFVLFFDRSQELLEIQTEQQTKNELSLLNRQQEKLLQSQRHLISELVTAKAELEIQRRILQENHARSKEFLAMMSHDFRTPLTSIVGYVEHLEESDVVDESVQEAIQAISRGSKHILSLVENVIDKAKVDRQTFHTQSVAVDVRELLTDVAAIMAPLAAEKGLSFSAVVEADVPNQLMLDPGGVRQVVINLVGNAIKFTDIGTVSVSVKNLSDEIQIVVSDTGAGIDSEDQDRIFAAFQRVDESVRGSGLGLSITRQLTRLMDGDLRLESLVGEGTTVTVTLPRVIALSEPISQVAPKQTPPADVAQPSRILMVEDNADIRRLVELALTRDGHTLTIAADGLEAIHMSMSESPDLILMDINLPNLNGRDAARQVRELGFHGTILAFSARRDLDETNCRPEFDGVIHKPIRMAELLAKLANYL
ncbi:MAG: ATP-binding protein [Pseudomonadota bacterium]